MQLLISLLILAFSTTSVYALDTFAAAKRKAKLIYTGPLAVDIYCGCPYDSKLKVNLNACGYKKDAPKRAQRIEWEHVVPAYFFTKKNNCKSRKSCDSPVFKRMEGDLHNLRPAVGELNMVRSNKLYGRVIPKTKKFGRCEFYSDRKLTEPPDNVKGDVARITLYMVDKYKLDMPVNTLMLMREWNKQDPVSEEEKQINKKIYQIQGDYNSYIGK
jgi:deoxyribonuclease-1